MIQMLLWHSFFTQLQRCHHVGARRKLMGAYWQRALQIPRKTCLYLEIVLISV